MHSLEVRAPFLDRDVAEFVCRLPSRYKLRGSKRKYLLKKAAAAILPKEILNRGKRGFLIPTASWLRGRLRPQVDALLGESYLKQQGIFDPKTVTNLVAEHEPRVRTAIETTRIPGGENTSSTQGQDQRQQKKNALHAMTPRTVDVVLGGTVVTKRGSLVSFLSSFHVNRIGLYEHHQSLERL